MAKEYLKVLSCVEFGQNSDKKRWIRVGTAFPNASGTISVKLDALPVNGVLVIMPPDKNGAENEETPF